MEELVANVRVDVVEVVEHGSVAHGNCTPTELVLLWNGVANLLDLAKKGGDEVFLEGSVLLAHLDQRGVLVIESVLVKVDDEVRSHSRSRSDENVGRAHEHALCGLECRQVLKGG